MNYKNMVYKKLGTSELKVSELCMGTMMMGSQNQAKDSKTMLSAALDSGINFYDTAEMYSVPPNPETQGNSENIIGDWLKENGKRDKVILASKVTGRSDMVWVRGSSNKEKIKLNKENITYAIEHSLRRLKTDYIDLYQLHWPDRPIPMFGNDVEEAPLDSPYYVQISETLEILADLVKQGKIRYVGVSNENLNGVREFTRCANELGLPMIASLQNAYSLVNREFEGEFANYCMENTIGLMPYSILAMGFLSGKYMNGALPKGSRKEMFKNTTRYQKLDESDDILNAYKKVAKDEGISMNELAHAFVYQQPFIGSTIIGCTNLTQLKENIAAQNVRLSPECFAAIDKVHATFPNPCP
jgi:aryl-alcohol dehydrogenase-like predicted oxidoreductase